jgi:hypothetical protein
LGCAVGDRPNRVVFDMCIPLGGSGLTMPEHLADEIEACSKVASAAIVVFARVIPR